MDDSEYDYPFDRVFFEVSLSYFLFCLFLCV